LPEKDEVICSVLEVAMLKLASDYTSSLLLSGTSLHSFSPA